MEYSVSTSAPAERATSAPNRYLNHNKRTSILGASKRGLRRQSWQRFDQRSSACSPLELPCQHVAVASGTTRGGARR